MYIVAIAWLYVITLMAATESSITAGALTFVFYGALPCALFLWIANAPRRRRKKPLTQHLPDQPDRTDTEPDQ
jgi:biotin transporter BioY